jgi:hypothetical protein
MAKALARPKHQYIWEREPWRETHCEVREKDVLLVHPGSIFTAAAHPVRTPYSHDACTAEVDVITWSPAR